MGSISRERPEEPTEDIERSNEIFFRCECAGEGILLTQEKEDQEINFALFGYGVGYNPKPSLIERIKYAWYHIKTGKKYNDCIVMHYDKAKKVGEWLIDNSK